MGSIISKLRRRNKYPFVSRTIPLRLERGKQYQRYDGKITAPLVIKEKYFYCKKYFLYYTRNGTPLKYSENSDETQPGLNQILLKTI